MKLSAEKIKSFEQLENFKRETALEYLKAKFQGIDEKIFRTDYTGYLHDEIINWSAVYQTAYVEKICASCKNGSCTLPENVRAKNSRPFVKVSESPKGFKFLDVRWACDLYCKFNPLNSYNENFVSMFKKSGLSNSQLRMTFKNYEYRDNRQTKSAKLEAINAVEENSWLILAGKQGTGKTHLAVAIALKNLEQGQQVIFRLVSKMLDEIQNVIKDNRDYDGLMRNFMTVPCLILDDLGHENMTPARASYLHQIIDYRHRENLQTKVLELDVYENLSGLSDR